MPILFILFISCFSPSYKYVASAPGYMGNYMTDDDRGTNYYDIKFFTSKRNLEKYLKYTLVEKGSFVLELKDSVLYDIKQDDSVIELELNVKEKSTREVLELMNLHRNKEAK